MSFIIRTLDISDWPKTDIARVTINWLDILKELWHGDAPKIRYYRSP